MHWLALSPWVSSLGPLCPGLCGGWQNQKRPAGKPWAPRELHWEDTLGSQLHREVLSKSEEERSVGTSAAAPQPTALTDKGGGAAGAVSISGTQKAGLRIQEMENRGWRDFEAGQGLPSETVV